MIVAIADDVTGAAEIAGIGWRYGLKAQVCTTFDADADADLVVIDTNTRDATRDAARQAVEKVAHRLRTAQVAFCYKKVDSVLRGNVAAELDALSHALHKQRTILAPANPSKGRVIEDGRYLINRVPLNETEFGTDPEHPIRSSLVVDVLGSSQQYPVHVLKRSSYSGNETGVVVAEAQTVADLARWAECVDEHVLAAGGADFFVALLERKYSVGVATAARALTPLEGPKWFLCGSSSGSPHRVVATAQGRGVPVCLMPEALFQNPLPDESLTGQWADTTVSALAAHGCAVAVIGQPVKADAHLALGLRGCMADLVQRVLGRMRIGELFIEGGATAKTVLERMGWDTLDVLGEYGPGVVRLAVRGGGKQIITLKPGSYPWPDGAWCREPGRT